MKKVLVIILILVCCAGVGVLGYMVFRSKNIETIDIEGEMQTLYLVNECSVPDFEDAKLKVTYKNGNIKYVSLTNKSVKVTDFSTSIKNHGTMKITYKSKTINAEYNVVPAGLYYVSSEYVRNDNTVDSGDQIELKDSSFMFYLAENGVLQYFQSESTGYFMNDGYYDDTYYYQVGKDTLTLFTGKTSGGEPKTIAIKPDYNSETGELKMVSSTILYGSTGFPSSETVRTYSNFLMKTNVGIRSISLTEYGLVTSDTATQENYVLIKKDKTLESDGHNLYIRVRYESPLITYEDETGRIVNLLEYVSVRVTDKMISGFSSSRLTTSGLEHTYIIYNGWLDPSTQNGVILYYKIVE